MRTILFSALILAVVTALLASTAEATVIWNEGANGNLSASGATPTPFILGLGTSSIIGNVTGGPKTQAWFNLTIPTGDDLSSIVLASYTSTDQQGFFGVQAGTSFSGSTNTASNYLGYTHFGTGAANGSQPATNLVGVNVEPIMGDNIDDSIGSQGFTPPLGAGSYTFLTQQLGASTNFQWDFTVSPIPEPASITVLALTLGTGCLSRRLGRRSLLHSRR